MEVSLSVLVFAFINAGGISAAIWLSRKGWGAIFRGFNERFDNLDKKWCESLKGMDTKLNGKFQEVQTVQSVESTKLTGVIADIRYLRNGYELGLQTHLQYSEEMENVRERLTRGGH